MSPRTGSTAVVRLRVRYPETDRMGVVHHSHFFIWYELGRTEFMRDRGCAYGELEASGIFFPVIEAGSRYRRPARYDEELNVETTLEELTAATVRFTYRLVRPGPPGSDDSEELAHGYTVHGCTTADGKPRRIAPELRSRLQPDSAPPPRGGAEDSHRWRERP